MGRFNTAKSVQKSLLKSMIRVRCFEKKVSELKMSNKIFGPVHTCIGEEAVDVGVCSALQKKDYIVGNFRSHGHLIAKGSCVNRLMAEIFGKKTGSNGGRGGSMHLCDPSVGSLGSSAIVGSGIPTACGAAFASLFKEEKRIACTFFGDGASQEGVFYESLNLASVWNLPVLFVLINNGYAITTPLSQVSVSQDLYRKAEPFGIKSIQVDGQMVEDIYENVLDARNYIINGKGPVLIEAKTSLFHPHQEGEHFAKLANSGYRDVNQVEEWREKKDPIKIYSDHLISQGIISESFLRSLFNEEEKCVSRAVNFAESSPSPLVNDVYDNIFV